MKETMTKEQLGYEVLDHCKENGYRLSRCNRSFIVWKPPFILGGVAIEHKYKTEAEAQEKFDEVTSLWR